LNVAQTDRRNRGWETSIVLATYFAEEGFRRMTKVEELLRQLLGDAWLNSGAGKDAGFGVLREATEAFPRKPDALIIVTATNIFKPTAKMAALEIKEQKRLLAGGHDAHHRLAAQGLMTIIDGFTAVAQTPERVCVCMQEVGAESVMEPRCFAQNEFGGRLKMFGEDELTPEPLKKEAVQ
jgi:hypothetical protein